MIFPEPESDLTLNLLVVAADMIKILKKSKDFIFIDTLLDRFVKLDKRRTKDLFYSSITILFSLGAIEMSNHMVRLSSFDTT